MDVISPIVADLTSLETHNITGRGRVYVVPNPRDTQNDNWGWLIGSWVRLDGRIVEVRSVESFRTYGLYPAGRPIGIIVREIDAQDAAPTGDA